MDSIPGSGRSLGREGPWVGKVPGSGRSLEKEMETNPSFLDWKIPWREEPGGVQSMGSQRVGHNLVTKTKNNTGSQNTLWRIFAAAFKVIVKWETTHPSTDKWIHKL